MGLLRNLFSVPGIVEAGEKAIDKAILTTEEKNDYFLKFVEASLPMNVSRRIIAVGVTSLWVIGGAIAIIAILIGSTKVEALIAFMNVYVMPPFTLLTSFYFWRTHKNKDK